MGRTIGIDLGTTNTVVAVRDETGSYIISSPQGERLIPSVVGFGRHGERLVGTLARRAAVTNPGGTVGSAKRLMGRRADDPELPALSARLPYRVVADPDTDGVLIEAGGGRFSPAEIAAHVLAAARSAAEAALGEPVTEAVITVPAYFGDAARAATRDAGRIAGLEVRRILPEPTAAALAYGLERGANGKTVAVVDLGGGTFDVSILRLADGVFEVLATAGDALLGGDDWDARVVDWILHQVSADTPGLLDAGMLARVREAAEATKIALSSAESAEVNLPYLWHGSDGPRHLAATLTRAEYQAMSADLLARTTPAIEQAMADAKLLHTDIDEVVLVGGMTRSPALINHVRSLFAREPRRDLNPDEVVALGAAAQAGVLDGSLAGMVLVDVTPHSLGVQLRTDEFSVVIPRNTAIPTSYTSRYSTVVDNQLQVDVRIFAGESPSCAENTLLGEFRLSGIEPAPAGTPEIDVSMTLDADGILAVSAVDRVTGKQASISISHSARHGAPQIGASQQRLRLDDERTRQRLLLPG